MESIGELSGTIPSLIPKKVLAQKAIRGVGPECPEISIIRAAKRGRVIERLHYRRKTGSNKD
jgi:hypothetical protein